jgi:hypothetical protein
METRTQTIIRNTKNWAQGREESIKILAQRIIDIYHTHIVPEYRTHTFSNTGNALRDQTNNKKFIERCINGEIRFPADMEEAWVMALDEPHRSRLVSDLAHRYGLLPVYENTLKTTRTTILHSAKLMHETSQALEVMARMELDGVLDDNDLPHMQIAVLELDDVASHALTMKRMLAERLAPKRGTIISRLHH